MVLALETLLVMAWLQSVQSQAIMQAHSGGSTQPSSYSYISEPMNILKCHRKLYIINIHDNRCKSGRGVCFVMFDFTKERCISMFTH